MLFDPRLGLLLLWSLTIAWFDWRARRIPNLLSLGSWCVGASVCLLTGRSWLGDPWQSAAWAAGLGLILTLPGYAFGKLGAGDVKYLTGIGLLTSWQTLLTTFTVASLVAGCLAMVWLLQRSPAVQPWLARLSAQWPRLADAAWFGPPPAKPRFPFGTFLSFGLCLSLYLRH